jgi:hypothetical protein
MIFPGFRSRCTKLREWMNCIPTTMPQITIAFSVSSSLGRASRSDPPAANSVAICAGDALVESEYPTIRRTQGCVSWIRAWISLKKISEPLGPTQPPGRRT